MQKILRIQIFKSRCVGTKKMGYKKIRRRGCNLGDVKVLRRMHSGLTQEVLICRIIHEMDIQEPEFTSEQVRNVLFTQDAGNQCQPTQCKKTNCVGLKGVLLLPKRLTMRQGQMFLYYVLFIHGIHVSMYTNRRSVYSFSRQYIHTVIQSCIYTLINLYIHTFLHSCIYVYAQSTYSRERYSPFARPDRSAAVSTTTKHGSVHCQ